LPLRDNGPMVVFVVDEVDRTTADLATGFYDGVVNFETVEAFPAKSGDQAGVDIDYAIFEFGGDQEPFEESAESDEICIGCFDSREYGMAEGLG